MIAVVHHRTAVLMACLLFTAAARAAGERLPLRTYSVADGLAHNAIQKIVRDSRGFLWFATLDGLSRFDGYTFTNYGVEQGLPHRTVNDLLETRNGDLWVATNAGLVRFNPRGMPARPRADAPGAAESPPMFTVVLPEDKDRYARMITTLVETRDGTVWCGSLKYLYKLESQNGRASLRAMDLGQPAGVLDLVEDDSGTLWIASFSGLYRLSTDGSIVHFTKDDGLPDNNIHDLLRDRDGRLWASTRFAGVFRFTADATGPPRVVEAYRRRDGMPTDWVFQLHETVDRRLWAATNMGLVEVVSGEGRTEFRSYGRRHGLTFQEVTALAEDSSGSLWLGTNAAGAMKLTRDGFVTFDERDGLLTVNAIVEDAAGHLCLRGSVLAQPDTATDESFVPRLGRFDGRVFHWFPLAPPFDFGWVYEHTTVRSRDGEWWVGGGPTLYRFPAATDCADLATARPLATYTSGQGLPAKAGGQIWRMFPAANGDVWLSVITTPNGLARWERATGTMQDVASVRGLPSLKDELPNAFGEDRQGNIWVGLTSGVARYRDGDFAFFGASSDVTGAIANVHLDRAGRIWLASTRGGLIRVDDPAAETPSFRAYTVHDGLSGNSAEVITEDLLGRIYVATGRGLDQLDPETGRIRHFSTADGLAPGNIISAFRDRDGALWFGTHRGLSRMVPRRSVAPVAPPILITGVVVAGEPYRVATIGETALALPDLDSSRNQVQIDYVAIGFSAGEVLRYQYRLEGSNDDWSAPSDRRSVNFARLSPGRYRFAVRAANSDGVTSTEPAVVAFTILRPVWQRWWFITLGGLALAAIVVALHRARLRRLLEVANLRTRIATDLHDDIGADLTKIAILSEVARQNEAPERGGDTGPLASIARLSRESVAAMSDIVWAVNPRRDSLVDLIRRMRSHAEEVCLARNITLEFVAPQLVLSVGVDTRRDVYLIFKEAVSNAARHSSCTRLEVSLEVQRHDVTLTVRDNGRGFDPASADEGDGLVNMRKRAEARGASLDITSSAGSGTSVRVTLPL